MARSNRKRSDDIKVEVEPYFDESEDPDPDRDTIFIAYIDSRDQTLRICDCCLTDLLDLLERVKRLVDQKEKECC